MSPQTDCKIKIAPEFKTVDPAEFCRVIVELTGEKNDEVLAIITACHGEFCRETKIIPLVVARIPFSALQTMANSKQVKRLLVDKPIKILIDKIKNII